MLYFIGWSYYFLLAKFYLGYKVIGRGNIPPKGAFILVSNHVSYLDPILLGTSVYRSLNYMARDTLFKRRCFGWIMRHLNSFPVKRGKGDLNAIKQSLKILESDRPLVIFPEGTRSKDRRMKTAKPGVGFIVAKSGVPVIPAYVEGSFDAMPRGFKTLKRHPVAVYIGEPIYFDPVTLEKKDKESYQAIADGIMAGIARIKEKYGCN